MEHFYPIYTVSTPSRYTFDYYAQTSVLLLASFHVKMTDRYLVLHLETFNPLSAELNPICHLLALLGAHHIFHVSGLRVKDISP
jgi:transposase